MNWVTYPLPLTICGNRMGDGADCVASATGIVVSRKSPRLLVSERNVSAANGTDDDTSSTPVNPAGRPETSCSINAALCPVAVKDTGTRLLPTAVCPSFGYAF